jgi:hypothetical protein
MADLKRLKMMVACSRQAMTRTAPSWAPPPIDPHQKRGGGPAGARAGRASVGGYSPPVGETSRGLRRWSAGGGGQPVVAVSRWRWWGGGTLSYLTDVDISSAICTPARDRSGPARPSRAAVRQRVESSRARAAVRASSRRGRLSGGREKMNREGRRCRALLGGGEGRGARRGGGGPRLGGEGEGGGVLVAVGDKALDVVLPRGTPFPPSSMPTSFEFYR